MDSRAVARAIKREIWPALRGHGFSKFSTRTAWRYQPEQIHVVNFQSFNSYLADGLGFTTFSFALNLGIYFRAVPEQQVARKESEPPAQPKEHRCHFRHKLLTRLPQASPPRTVWPAALDAHNVNEASAKVQDVLKQPIAPRNDLWKITPDGSNLPEVIANARDAIAREGLHWFAKFASMEDVLQLLLTSPDLPEFYGSLQSPAAKHLVGHIAKSLHRAEVAEPMLAEAAAEFVALDARFAPFRRRR